MSSEPKQSPLTPQHVLVGAPRAGAQGEEEAEGKGAQGASEEGGEAPDQSPEGGASSSRGHPQDAAGPG